MICVDPLVSRSRHGMFKRSCHLFHSKNDLIALHEFALKIGCKLSWFQDGKYPHYDLVPRLRRAAVKDGASEVSRQAIIVAYVLRGGGK